MRIIQDLSAEARILEDREEQVVREINEQKKLIRSAMLAGAKIKELQKELEGVRDQQKRVEVQLMEAQFEQASLKGLLVAMKGIGGKKNGH